MNYIHAINQVIQKSAEYNSPVYLAVIDYESALDSVEIAAVMKSLRVEGVEEAYIRILDDIYMDCTAAAIFQKPSKNFLVERVVGKETQSGPKYSQLV